MNCGKRAHALEVARCGTDASVTNAVHEAYSLLYMIESAVRLGDCARIPAAPTAEARLLVLPKAIQQRHILCGHRLSTRADTQHIQAWRVRTATQQDRRWQQRAALWQYTCTARSS
jgi:hypothetical protein